MRQRLAGKTATAISHGECQLTITMSSQCKAQPAIALFGHCVNGIADQIDQHLLQAILVAPGDPEIWLDLPVDRNILFAQPLIEEKQRCIDGLRHVNRS